MKTAFPMPVNARWAVRGVDYDQTTEVALVYRNRAPVMASLAGMSPQQFKASPSIYLVVQHELLRSFWRLLGAA